MSKQYLAICLTLLLSTLSTGAAHAQHRVAAEPVFIDNLDEVTPDIWRGAAPRVQDLRLLKEKGVATIVDLRLGGTKEEAKAASKLGLRYVHIPLGYLGAPRRKVLQFLRVVCNESSGRVFIHCRRGEDRTGMLVGIYRELVQGWSFSKTYAEMRQHNFKPWLVLMKRKVEVAPQNLETDRRELAVSSQIEPPM